MMNIKQLWMIAFFISYTFCAFAQIDYYYYKGKKINLSINQDKITISIPKKNKELSNRIKSKIQVVKSIHDDIYDVMIVDSKDYKYLASSILMEEDSTQAIMIPCYRTGNGIEVFSTPYLNIRLKKEQDIKLLKSYAEKYNFKIVKNMPLMPLWYILTVTEKSVDNPLHLANLLWESGAFAASVPDLSSSESKLSDDRGFSRQWGLLNTTYPGIDISAESAWNYSTGMNVKIAILDDGVDVNHVDLQPNISNLSYDTETDSSPSRLYGEHGTHCAGIAAAVKDNYYNIAGVAPNASIVPISNSLDTTTNSRIKRASGIVWAYQHGVDIISCSWWSTTNHSAIEEAIDSAFMYGRNGKGSIIVFASGNQSKDSICYPANCNDKILTVGAIKEYGARLEASNYGNGLDLVAPGNEILSTIPGNDMEAQSGTSMACPHVAGVAALVLERNPELTVSEVNNIINRTAKKLSHVNFDVSMPDGSWNNEYGYGLVDAFSAVINTPKIEYLQNDTITGTKEIVAEKIYVGKDVTDRKEQGEVHIGPGNISLKAKTVILKNSTKVPLGTNLKIKN